MNDLARVIVERISGWPDDAIAELQQAIDNIEIKHSLVFRLSDDERTAVRAGLAQAERGEFVSDEQIATFYNQYR